MHGTATKPIIRNLLAGFAFAVLGGGLVPGAALAARNAVTIGMQLEPPHLDPTAGAAAAIDEVVYANVFEGLTRIGEDGAVLPALAETWDISDDGRTYTFYLARGVTFHDGTAFDAHDAVFSLDRARDATSTNAQKGLFASIDEVHAVDDHTLRVSLKRPVGNFLFNMGWGDAVMVAPQSAADNKFNPIGTGPFKFSRWVRGDRIELIRNPDYWRQGNVLDRAVFKFISEPAAALSALLAGDVDGFSVFPAVENLAQLKADPRFSVVVGTTEGETILAINNKKPPLNDIRVRRAIAHAIDRQTVINGAMFGYGTPIGSHFAPHHPAYVDLSRRYPHDIARARTLLAEAGYGAGLKLTLKLPPPSYARRGGEIIAADLKKAGIDVDIIPVGWAKWLSEVFKKTDYDLTIVSHTEPFDIGIYARDTYYFNYDSPALKAVIAALDTASDADTRTDLLQQAQKILAEDAVNVFLFQLPKTGAWNRKLKGLWSNAPVQANDLTAVFWED